MNEFKLENCYFDTNIDTFNLNKEDNNDYIINKFPDGQTNIQLKVLPACADIKISLDSSEKIILLMQMVDALKRAGTVLNHLTILYFYGARSDRQMNSMISSVDALIICNLINAMGFKKVKILDIHNLETGLHINNFENIFNPLLEKEYTHFKDYFHIIPDAGASKKQNLYTADNSIQCLKKRTDIGHIELKIYDIERTVGRDCIILDDLIDGGGTFIQIAKKLREYKVNKLVLICTHAIFSKGINELTGLFDKILVTNSFTRQPLDALNHPKIQIFNVQ